MARRPVFVPKKNKPGVTVFSPEFMWSGGFAVSQKQKNITALHEGYRRDFPEAELLEISSKSMQDIGIALSAFNLRKYVPSADVSVPLECVFQGGKVFSGGGPYTDMYFVSPREAKRDPRLRESGQLKSFYFEGQTMPLLPRTAFYNWLYINALMENPELAEKIVCFDGFTDIEFNPEKSLNCQAEAAALYLSLFRADRLDECRSFDGFVHAIT